MKPIHKLMTAGLALAIVAAGIVIAEEAGTMQREFADAQAAMADRDFARAAGLLKEFSAKYPAGPQAEEALVLLVRARIALGDHEGALETGRSFTGSFGDSPWKPKVLFLMGEAYARMRGFRDAAAIYREQVDFLSGENHERKVAGYYLDLAKAAYEGVEQPDEFGRPKLVKDFTKARDYYEKARSIRLDEAEASLVSHRIADSRFQLNDFAGAIAEWEKLLKDHPASAQAAEATYSSGVARLKTGDILEARRLLRELREKWGDSPLAALALIRLGESYQPLATRVEDDLSRGVGYWREFRKLYPAHEEAAKVAYEIGEALFNAGKHDEAIAEFRAFLAAFPDGERSPAAQDRIARAFYAKTDYDQAIAEWKTFLGKWPNHELWSPVQAAIAEAAFAKGALPFTQGIAGKEPDGALLSKADEGFRAFLMAFPVHDRAGEAQYFLGEIRYRLKDYAGAIAEWKVAAGKYAQTKWAASSLFRIAATEEKDLGNLSRAIEGYEELVTKYPASPEAGTAKQLLDQFRAKLLELVTERVRRTDEKCEVLLRTRNIEALSFKAYRVNAEEIFRKRLSLLGVDSIVTEVVKADWAETIPTPEYEKFRLFERQQVLKLEGPGAWIVTCHDEDLTATALVVVSDIAMVVKEAPAQTLVFTLNERTGLPAPGVRVLLASGDKVKVEGATGPDGVFVHEKALGGEAMIFAETGGHVALTGLAPGTYSSFGYTTKAYLYTDRPLYRPGQEVNLKGIVRRVERGAYTTSAGAEVRLEVRDSRDTVVLEEKVTTNEYGTFSRTLTLPEAAALGDWRIIAVTKDEKTFTGGFAVREYKKPEFTITARTDKRSYLPGEEVKVSVALRYFFGGPVPKTKVRWRLGRGAWSFDAAADDEFAWFTRDPERERERERREAASFADLKEGELTTDADGNAEMTFKAEDLDQDARYLVMFEALDLNRQWVRDGASVVVSRQGFFAMAKTERKVYRPNEELFVRLTTVDALHFPVSAEGEMVVARLSVVDGREVESIVSRGPVKTGDDGRAAPKVKIEKPGEYRLRFLGKDRAGNAVTGAALVTIAGESEDLAKHAKLVAARQIYREGETAEVLVNSPVAPACALLTFEGERVLDYRVVTLTERSTTLSLPMKPEYSPNVFVKIAIPGGGELREAEDEIFVFKYLEVAVAPDRAEAKPGEDVTFRFTTTDQRGNPVSAEVSLALVDRAILALEPDRAEQMKPFFYDQRRTLAVTTGSSYSFRYQGTTAPTNKDLLSEELRRQGREAFNRTMKYVRAARELLDRGDLESAAIELRKALQVTPGNFLAAQMLKETETRLLVQREDARLKEYARRLDKNAVDREAEEYEDAAGEEMAKKAESWGVGGGAGGRAAGRSRRGGAEPPGAPAARPAPTGAPAPQPMEGSPAKDAKDQLGFVAERKMKADAPERLERENQL
ncbi:MAG: outer membrane protein assembly factor BamD, partial [Planctomycetes bacterium]|nr:outer membrane protein assembly factor BamD [Planctomycetota bacterium]